MTKASLAAFRRTITVDWPKATEANARALLVKTAREGNARIVAEQTAREGVPPDVTVYANTPANPNIDSVKLPGPIVFKYDYRREIVAVGLEELIKASPRDKGDYIAGHTVFVNGSPVDVLPADIDPQAEIWIANAVPYARRIEIGKTKSGRDFVIQVPNRIYERIAKTVLARRYGNSARITFGYVTLPDAYRTKGRLSSHYRAAKGKAGQFQPSLLNIAKRGSVMRKRNQKPGSEVRAPAIFIEALR